MKKYLLDVFQEHKTRIIISFILAIVCFAMCLQYSPKAGGILSLGLIGVAFVHLPIRDSKVVWTSNFLWAVLIAFSVCFLSTLISYEAYFWSIGLKNIVLSVVLVLCGVFVVFLATLRFRLSVIVVSLACMILSTINHYVYMFRGNEFTPNDIFSSGTALNVVTQYHLSLTRQIVYSWSLWVLLIMIGFILAPIKIENKKKARYVLLITETVFCIVLALFTKNMTPQTYRKYGSLLNGYFLNFAIEIRDMRAVRPDGYSETAVSQIVNKYEGTGVKNPGVLPTIFVIMDESYADFNVYDNELETNVEITPFIRSLTENTIRGYALASVFGGNTANSEYEFLTGNSLAFLPSGAVVYQQYMNNNYSLVSELNHLGYKTVATHPYYADGWSRDRVYPELGFDEMLFLDDYPQEDMVRGYVSDQEMFDYLIAQYEAKGDDEALFLFGITMQNHGGYEDSSYHAEVKISGLSDEYEDAEQYLSLINETDAAFERFIDYFMEVDEPVIILFFGDHQPGLNAAFYEELNGGVFDTLDEQMLQYKVPFVVWTNYDIEEETVEETSINYLSNYIYQAAGWEGPVYHQFLMDEQNIIPAINSQGYYSTTAGRYMRCSEASGDEADALKQYSILQFNNMFDKKHRNDIFRVS